MVSGTTIIFLIGILLAGFYGSLRWVWHSADKYVRDEPKNNKSLEAWGRTKERLAREEAEEQQAWEWLEEIRLKEESDKHQRLGFNAGRNYSIGGSSFHIRSKAKRKKCKNDHCNATNATDAMYCGTCGEMQEEEILVDTGPR